MRSATISTAAARPGGKYSPSLCRSYRCIRHHHAVGRNRRDGCHQLPAYQTTTVSHVLSRVYGDGVERPGQRVIQYGCVIGEES